MQMLPDENPVWKNVNKKYGGPMFGSFIVYIPVFNTNLEQHKVERTFNLTFNYI